MKPKILVLLFSFLVVAVGHTQTCDCKEYIYLNEPNDGGKVHKYLCNPDGSLTEINPSGPWYNNNTTGDQLDEPHGIAFDLNGYLYIAETSSGDVRRLDCEGNIFPESTFVIPGEGGWNFASIGNEVFINRSTQADVAAYNVCSGSYTNGFEFCDAENNDWGFYYDKRTGYFYSAYKGTGATTGNKASILRYTIADFGSGNCIPVWIGPGDGTLTVGVSETVPNTFVRGLTTDANGNLYVVERLPDQQTARLLKYDSNGLFVAATAYDATDGNGGWFTAAGVAYSETCNCLHVSTASQNDDCISTFDLNLNYLGPGVPGNAGGFTAAKAIGILKECCPTLQSTFNRRVCATVGAKYFLNVEAFDDCDGVVCGSSWVPQGTLTGMTFDPCDNSVTITGEGCGTFALSLGASPGKGCTAQTSMFTICAGTPAATVTPVQGTCTGSTPNNNASINITGATFVTRYGFSTGATYTGPNFAGATQIVGGTATIPNLVHNTQYTVRVFLRANCFVDYTVMTPAITCNSCNIMVTCNPMPQNNCSLPNGSANLTLTGGQGNITYLWSSGETTSSISGKLAGTYTVTVTDDFLPNCTATCQAVIASTITPPTVTCAKTDNSNCAIPNGTATATATGVTYLWSNGGTAAMITGLSNATYTVTVTSTTTGCTNTCSAIVATTTTLPTATCTPMNNTNCATPNGSAMVTTNGNQILWSTGATSASITGLSAGTYTVTVTNTTTGCTNTCEAIIGSTTTLPTATCTPMNNTNCASPNGSAMVTTNGNQILWSTGATSASITGLSAGTYTVTVTNTTTGCTNTCQAMVGTTTVDPTCTITVNSQPSCANLTGGSITVNPNPAGTYNYAWSDSGPATASRSGLTGATYTVTVTNTTTGCTGVCQTTLDTPMNCCNINAIVPQNLECLDNGTPALITDNTIRFSAMVTNTNTSLTGYNVTINGGTTITPNTNVPYGITQFTLGAGTAGGGATFTVTVTDSATPGCTQTFTVTDPGTCTPATPECPPVQCGTATIQVNGN